MSYKEIELIDSTRAKLQRIPPQTRWEDLPPEAAMIFDIDWSTMFQGLEWYIVYRQNFDPIYPQQLLSIPVGNSFADPSWHYDMHQMRLFKIMPWRLTEKQLQALGSIYDFESDKEVIQFISNHPFLYELLVEAIPAFQSCFGSGMRVDLIVRTDPEDDFQELFGYIHQSGPIDEIKSSLERFDDEWFLENLGRAQGKLNFNLLF